MSEFVASREAVERLLALGIAIDQGHTSFFHGGVMEPAPNTVRMAREMLAEVANEGYRHADAMSADVSRFAMDASKFRVCLHTLALAVRRDPAWDPLGCSGGLFSALGMAENALVEGDEIPPITDQQWEDFARTAGFEP